MPVVGKKVNLKSKSTKENNNLEKAREKLLCYGRKMELFVADRSKQWCFWNGCKAE